jgi:hypothetical protein
MATFINLLRSHHPLSLKASHVDNENDALNVQRLSAEKRRPDIRLADDCLWLVLPAALAQWSSTLLWHLLVVGSNLATARQRGERIITFYGSNVQLFVIS